MQSSLMEEDRQAEGLRITVNKSPKKERSSGATGAKHYSPTATQKTNEGVVATSNTPPLENISMPSKGLDK